MRSFLKDETALTGELRLGERELCHDQYGGLGLP